MSWVDYDHSVIQLSIKLYFVVLGLIDKRLIIEPVQVDFGNVNLKLGL